MDLAKSSQSESQRNTVRGVIYLNGNTNLGNNTEFLEIQIPFSKSGWELYLSAMGGYFTLNER